MPSRSPAETQPGDGPAPVDETRRIIRFMLVKAAVFVVAPLCLALFAVWMTLR